MGFLESVMVDAGPGRNETSMVNRPLNKLSSKNTEINLSVFTLLFREIVCYGDSRATTVDEHQAKLADMGKHVGSRYLELVWFREKSTRRENRLIHLLMFVQKNLWKALYGKEMDNLEQPPDTNSTFYLIEKDPLVNRINPHTSSALNCGAFNAGIVEGKRFLRCNSSTFTSNVHCNSFQIVLDKKLEFFVLN